MGARTTENKTVCNALLGNLIERGLTIEQPRLFVIDGGKAIRAAVLSTFGSYAAIHRCREHYADFRIMPTRVEFASELVLKKSA